MPRLTEPGVLGMAPGGNCGQGSPIPIVLGHWGRVSPTLVRMFRPQLPGRPSPSLVPSAPESVGKSRVDASRWSALREYSGAGTCVLTSTAIAFVLQRFAQLADLVMIQLLGVVFVALRYNVKITLIASLFAVVLFDFLFIPPRLAFAWSDAKNIITFGGIVVVAAVISLLNERIREQEKLARESAKRTNALYELNVELSNSTQVQHLAAITSRHLEQLFQSRTTILLASSSSGLRDNAIELSPPELELAKAACSRSELKQELCVAGLNTWFPLTGLHETLGAVGIAWSRKFSEQSDSGALFIACANQLATAIERTQLTQVAQKARVEAETERMRSSLLSAVSHDLKTPLATIIAAGTTLLEHGRSLSGDDSRELIGAMVAESERLSRMVQNLLAATRLESSTIELHRSPEAVEELVAAAVQRIQGSFEPKRIDVSLPQDLPWVLVDPALIEQVLINLLENALRYSEATVCVSASLEDLEVVVRVADHGPGVAEEDIHKIFEKFYRGKSAHRRDGGAGLGLTICRAIIRLHGGRIGLRNRSNGGAVAEFSLPVTQPLESQPSELEGQSQ